MKKKNKKISPKKLARKFNKLFELLIWFNTFRYVGCWKKHTKKIARLCDDAEGILEQLALDTGIEVKFKSAIDDDPLTQQQLQDAISELDVMMRQWQVPEVPLVGKTVSTGRWSSNRPNHTMRPRPDASADDPTTDGGAPATTAEEVIPESNQNPEDLGETKAAPSRNSVADIYTAMANSLRRTASPEEQQRMAAVSLAAPLHLAFGWIRVSLLSVQLGEVFSFGDPEGAVCTRTAMPPHSSSTNTTVYYTEGRERLQRQTTDILQPVCLRVVVFPGTEHFDSLQGFGRFRWVAAKELRAAPFPIDRSLDATSQLCPRVLPGTLVHAVVTPVQFYTMPVGALFYAEAPDDVLTTPILSMKISAGEAIKYGTREVFPVPHDGYFYRNKLAEKQMELELRDNQPSQEPVKI